MEKVLIDITKLFDQGHLIPRGTDKAVYAYIRHYNQRALAVVWFCQRIIILSSQTSAKLFSLLSSSSPKNIYLAKLLILKDIFLFKTVKNQLKGAFLFNIGHAIGVQCSRYHRLLKKKGIRSLYMIDDLIPLKYPQYCHSSWSKRYNVGINLILENAEGIIANSDVTMKEIITHALASGRTHYPPLISASPGLGIPHLTCRTARPLSAPYFVILGTLEPRKNHALLLRVWQQFMKQEGNNTPRLVIIGAKRGRKSEDILALLKESDLLQGVVMHLTECFDEELIGYLSHAQALLFPSFVEGYGIPLAEALSLGVPVIASDLPVFREVAKDIPEYLDPFDESSWLDMVKNYSLCENNKRAEQFMRIKGFLPRTWTAHFEKVDAFLESLR